MNKEKLISLLKYMGRLEDKLNSPVTLKHAHRPDTYKEFLKREIAMVKAKVDAAVLEGMGGKK